MAITCDPRRTISGQMNIFLFKLREYRAAADTIVQMIDGVNGQSLTGRDLSNILNVLVIVKKDAGVVYKKAVRQRLLAELPTDFPDAATRNTKIGLANTAAKNLITECNKLLAIVSAAGQIVNANETVGLIDSIIVSPESDALRVVAAAVQNEIEDYNLPPIR